MSEENTILEKFDHPLCLMVSGECMYFKSASNMCSILSDEGMDDVKRSALNSLEYDTVIENKAYTLLCRTLKTHELEYINHEAHTNNINRKNNNKKKNTMGQQKRVTKEVLTERLKNTNYILVGDFTNMNDPDTTFKHKETGTIYLGRACNVLKGQRLRTKYVCKDIPNVSTSINTPEMRSTDMETFIRDLDSKEAVLTSVKSDPINTKEVITEQITPTPSLSPMDVLKKAKELESAVLSALESFSVKDVRQLINTTLKNK